MLSLFPELFTYQLLAVFILRVVVAMVFILGGYISIFKNRQGVALIYEEIGLRPSSMFVWLIGVVSFVGGIFLFIGLYTQAVIIPLSLVAILHLIIKIKKPFALKDSLGFFVLLSVITPLLLFFGPGIFAFDLPL